MKTMKKITDHKYALAGVTTCIFWSMATLPFSSITKYFKE